MEISAARGEKRMYIFEAIAGIKYPCVVADKFTLYLSTTYQEIHKVGGKIDNITQV